MTAVTVRVARPGDYHRIGRLTVAAYRADGQLAEASDYTAVLSDVAGRAAQSELLVAVESDTGQVVGSVAFVLPGTAYAEVSRPGEAEFRMLAVDPAAQGRGVARALVEACVERARAVGATAVVICTREVAGAAQRLYDRLGFTRVPELDWEPLPGVRLLALRLELD